MSSILFNPPFYSEPYPGIRVNESEWNVFLSKLAQNHAKYMADVQRQGHQHWDTRYKWIRDYFGPEYKASEVCAESWDRQYADPLPEIIEDACRSWSFSPGHWEVVSTVHEKFGDGLYKGKNGIYYVCIIVVDRR